MRVRATRALSIAAVFSLITTNCAFACDPCSLYTISRLQAHKAGAVSVGVSEQITDFSKSSDSNVEEGEFVETFSVTQFAISYDLTESLGVQLGLPVVYRGFDRVTDEGSDSGSDSGIGDMALLGNYSFARYQDENWSLLASVTGGVKFPTGDTGSLGRVGDADHHDDESATERLLSKHSSIAGASGGRALSLGTGSYDYIVGVNSLNRWNRLLLLASGQYTVRTEGDFSYEFADDFVWSAGPGAYVVLDDAYSVALQAALSGEHKGTDKLAGASVQGSKISNLYLGPAVLFTLGSSVVGEVGLDLRVAASTDDSSVVPNLRHRSGISYRF